MYEETKSSIDWKGIFLKVIIAFLIILIAVKGYTTLKGKDTNKGQITTSTETVSDSKSSTTFTQNMEKLRNAGETYFETNKEKLPKIKGSTSMVTLNELIEKGIITSLTDEDGKTCDGESSYVTAILENDSIKLKANLVCGSSSSYSLVYMDENASQTTSNSTTTTNNGNSTTTSTTTVNGGNSSTNTTVSSGSSSCGNSCIPSVSVSTNTSVSQSITTGSATNSNQNNYYTISFDKNGGTLNYKNQTVKHNGTVAYPGDNQKVGCSFTGWYYNDTKYDFSTPVTKDMTLTAKYNCGYYNDNYYYGDDYYYNDDYYYGNDYYYGDNNSYYNNYNLATATITSTVYTAGWDDYGTNTVSINHTLRLPNSLDNSRVAKVRIRNISYGGPINNASAVNAYNSRHANTFLYALTGSEYYNSTAYNFATINRNAVAFYYNTNYKTLSNALSNGFDVSWMATSVASQCLQTFNVKNSYNLCGYGIYYNVTWEYQYYKN